MRRLLLLTMFTMLFLFFATAECAEWKLFAYNKHNSPYYLDNETVNYLSNSHVRVYIKAIPTAEQKVDQIKWYVAMKEKNKDFEGFFSHQVELESKTMYSLDFLEIDCIEKNDDFIQHVI